MTKQIEVTSVETGTTQRMTRAEFFRFFGKAEGKEILAGNLPHFVAVEVEAPAECQWFLRCTRPATTTVRHPILGDVPTCAKCAAFAR